MEQALGPPTMRDTLISNDAVVNWQGPLPEDLVFDIMTTHIVENFSDFLALSSTCKGMYNCSLSLRYRKVIIKSNRSIPTPVEIFCGRLFQHPDIAQFVQVLQIMGDGFVVDDQWQITALEEDCLWYILNHKGFTNLKTLALCLPILYDQLPASIQETRFSILSYPTLENVKLNLPNVPTTIFSRLSGVTSIEVRGSVKFSSRTVEPETVCSPTRLEIWDPCEDGCMVDELFSHNSALQLSSLKYFKVIIAPYLLETLEVPLSLCRDTLTHLEIYHAWKPEPLNLGSLPCLVGLTLSADIRTLPWAGSSRVGPRNFPWLISTLQSLIKTTSCPVQNITFLLRVTSFGILGSSRIRWQELDALFQPEIHHRWSNLNVFHLGLVNESENHDLETFERGYRPHLEEHLTICAPTLLSSGIFSLRALCKKMDVWNPRTLPNWGV